MNDSQRFNPSFTRCLSQFARFGVVILLLALTSCGGDTTEPPTTKTIGPGGGTVTGPDGAKVVIPAGALSQETEIAIAHSSASAPSLPSNVTSAGAMFAFTPHDTSFAKPVTVTVPFDPAKVSAGGSPTLYKTNAQGDWEEVAGGTVSGSSMSGEVTSFSDFNVVEPQKTEMYASWSIRAVNGNGQPDTLVKKDTFFGGVSESHVFDEIELYPPEMDKFAEAEVFVSDSGETYWASAESTNLGPGDDPIGSEAYLIHAQSYRKTSANATLEYVITETLLQAIDDSAGHDGPMYGGIDFELLTELHSSIPFGEFFNVYGRATLRGAPGAWRPEITTGARSEISLWDSSNFDAGVPSGHNTWYKVDLASPITIEVPLDAVPVGETFTVYSIVKARAYQDRNAETYMGAFFRDPAHSSGLNVEHTGLEVIETTVGEIPEPSPPEPAPECTTPDPAAGVIQFEAASYEALELPGSGAEIYVTRSGGSKGKVSVSFATSDGSATAGSDYEAVDTLFLFADGEEGTRVVDVPLIINDTEEPNKTVTLTLSDPRGCATLGDQDTATLTILDDDHQQQTYSIGGTVTGLVGTGLVLSDSYGFDKEISSNGPFTFDPAWPSGTSYDVHLTSQPSNPAQVCTVANGTGVIADADVTDILVTCAEPPPTEEGLDPSFGSSGKVTDGLDMFTSIGGAYDLALQADGKIVAVGAGNMLARYNADGSLDQNFGTGGVVEVVFYSDGSDHNELKSVAIQADNKIVVVGNAKNSGPDTTGPDWSVARYLPNGDIDTSFGPNGDGTIIINLGPPPVGTSNESAEDVVVQPDGKIVVAGIVGASQGTGNGFDNDFLVMRFTSAGDLDTGFSSDGMVQTDSAGNADLLYAVALQADGKIVAAGRVTTSGGVQSDVGLVRYNINGTLDTSFGSGGIMQDVTDNLSDEAADLAIQPDGMIVVAGLHNRFGEESDFLLARYDASGNPDPSFGNGGRVDDLFPSSPCDTCLDGANAFAVALQDDGKIVAVGFKNTDFVSDFAIARLNADGTPDTSFGTDGKLLVDFFGASDHANAVLIQPDGKMVVGGQAENGTKTVMGLIRVLP